MENGGRREQNKQRTRSGLEEAAKRLFAERGFEETTVRDIAAEAGVGERTFFRYFPSKEDIVVQQVRDIIPELRCAVRERPAAEPPYTALREAILSLACQHGLTTLALLVVGPIPLGPRSRGDRELLIDIEEAVTAAFLGRMADQGADPAAPATRLRAAVLARAAVSALRALRSVYGHGAQEDQPGVEDMVRAAFAVLDER